MESQMLKRGLLIVLLNPVLLLALDLGQPETLQQFLSEVAENEKKNRLREMCYLYELRHCEITLDQDGREKKRKSSTYEVIPLMDGVYRKLIKRNGKLLSKVEARKQQKKADSRLDKGKHFSAVAQSKLVLKRSERQRKEVQFWDEVIGAFHFRYLGLETYGGRNVAMLELLPHEGYKPSEKEFRILTKLKGRVWVDIRDLQITEVKLEFIKAFKIGMGIVVKVNKGASLWIQQRKVQDTAWFPRRFELNLSGRVFLLKRFNRRVIGDFTNYRRYKTRVRLLPANRDSTPKVRRQN